MTGNVTFTPAAGFHGKAAATYTVKDLLGTTSNDVRAIRVYLSPGQTTNLDHVRTD